MDGPDPYVGRKGHTQTFCVVRHPLERAISQYIYWSMVQVGCGKMDGSCAQQQDKFDDACKPHQLNRYIHERFNSSSGRLTNAVAAITGKLPTPAEYLEQWKKLDSTADDVYQYINFDTMPDYTSKESVKAMLRRGVRRSRDGWSTRGI